MKKTLVPGLFIALIIFQGCFNATIDTGKTPSTVVIQEKWASGWIYGLVPPKTVETMSKCSNGVATVSTKLSFLNQLVSGLTFGIYTPMEITVTCAANSSALLDGNVDEKQLLTIPKDASEEQVKETYKKAADLAVSSKKEIFVQYEN